MTYRARLWRAVSATSDCFRYRAARVGQDIVGRVRGPDDLSTEKLAVHGGPRAVRGALNSYRGAALIGKEEKAAVLEVLDSKSLYRYYGPNLLRKVEAFEADFASYVGTRFVLACSSGTAALRLCLVGLGIGPGDEVIVPAITFIASAGAVVAQGAVPVFAEVDRLFTLDAEDVEKRITSRTKAILPVHLFGVSCDMDRLRDVAHRHNVPIIEDAAQACGASYGHRRLGSVGAVGAFSFQLDKHITSGEGGALATDDEELFVRAAGYHDQGGQFALQRGGIHTSSRAAPCIGENLRMTEISGAILGCQLRRLDGLLERAVRARQVVMDACSDLRLDWVADPEGRARHANGVSFLAPTEELATEIAGALVAEGAQASRIYDGRTVYDNPQFGANRTLRRGCPFTCPAFPTTIDYDRGSCPRSEDLVARSVAVLLGPAYTDANLADVARAIRKVTRVLLT